MVFKIAPNATGPWTAYNYADTAKFAAGEKENISIESGDKRILRDLAERVAELASKDEQQVKIQLWKDHNALRTTQPLVLCDPENGWNDIITEETLECLGGLARRWEIILRKELFSGEELKDDKPIEPFFDVGYTYTESDWTEDTGRLTGGKDGGSYVWKAPIKDLEDLEKIKPPEIVIDYETSDNTADLAREVFDGLLAVNLKGIWWWSFGFTYDLARLIGLESMLLLFYDNPELVHGALKKISDGYEAKIRFLEDNNLLFLNNDRSYVGSGGLGYSDEMPAPDYDVEKVRLIDMWGHSESQETGNVSPNMFEEFIFKYQLPIIKRFSLACYGCCEPLDKRWQVVKKIPNLRRVSVSHWASNEIMSDNLQDYYIYSMKPTPTDLAVSEIDKDHIRGKMLKELQVTKDCVVEVIMKDNHTLCKNPKNLINWVKIIREVIHEVHYK